MGRKSKLTEKQWKEIGDALIVGEESTRSLAKKYGLSEAAIRARFPARRNDVKAVAHQILAAETALEALPLSSQLDTLSLLRRMRAMSEHLGAAAEYGAATAHRLMAIGHGKVQEIDDTAPLNDESMKALKGISVLTSVANESSKIALNLLNANKEAFRDNDDTPPAPVMITIEAVDASADPT